MKFPKMPKLPKWNESPYDRGGGVVKGQTEIRSHRRPRGRTAGRTTPPAKRPPSKAPQATPATPARRQDSRSSGERDQLYPTRDTPSRGRQAVGQRGKQLTPTNQPNRRAPKTGRTEAEQRPSPRDRFQSSTPMARAEERMRYIRGSAQADQQRRARAGGARAQLATRQDARPGQPHPMSGELARRNTQGHGRANRPHAALPGDAAKARPNRRAPAWFR